MANDKTRFIKLSKDLKTSNGNIFAKDSVLHVIAEATSYSLPQVLAIKAMDEDKLPYPTETSTIYSLALKEGDFTEVEAMAKVAYSVPFGFSFMEDDGTPLDLGLEDRYAEKDYTIDRDGNIQVKSGLEKTAEAECEEEEEKKEEVEKEAVKKTADVGKNMLTDSADKISTDFAEKVEGQDDPSVSEPWTADESEKPATAPILGELTGKVKKLRKLLNATEDNNLTSSNEDISIDYNTSVDGSGTVSDPYKADESEKPWKDENLGKVSTKKTADLSEQPVKNIPSDGSAGGDNLDDYSIEDHVDDGSKDEFRPKEAKKENLDKLSNLDTQPMKDADAMAPLAGEKPFSASPVEDDDDFPISAQVLGLTDEQEQQALSSFGNDNPITH